MRSGLLVVVPAVVGMFASSMRADVAMISPSKDNTLFEDPTGSLSNGAGGYLYAGKTGINAMNRLRRGIMAFDIAGNIPAGSIINSVTLSMELNNVGAHGVQTITLTKVMADWGEGISDAGEAAGGGGAPSEPNDATWIHRFFNTSSWTTAGGDFAGAPSAGRTVDANGTYVWDSTSNAAMVADVQDWLNNPSTNFGWMIRGNEVTPNSVARFGTQENTFPARRPVLTVDFTPTIPATSTFGVALALIATVGLGLTVLWRRQRA